MMRMINIYITTAGLLVIASTVMAQAADSQLRFQNAARSSSNLGVPSRVNDDDDSKLLASSLASGWKASERMDDDFAGVKLASTSVEASSVPIKQVGFKNVVETEAPTRLRETMKPSIRGLSHERDDFRALVDVVREANIKYCSYELLTKILVYYNRSVTFGVSRGNKDRANNALTLEKSFQAFRVELSRSSNPRLVDEIEAVAKVASALDPYLVELNDADGFKIGAGILIDVNERVFVLTCLHVVKANVLGAIESLLNDENVDIERVDLRKTTIRINKKSIDVFEAFLTSDSVDLALLPFGDREVNALKWQELSGMDLKIDDPLINIVINDNDQLANIGYVDAKSVDGTMMKIRGLWARPGFSGSPVFRADGSFVGLVAKAAVDNVPIVSLIDHKTIDKIVNAAASAL